MHSSKLFTLIVFIFMSLYSTDLLAQRQQNKNPSHTGSVKSLIEGIEKYHYKDAFKFASLFTKNCTLITSSGIALEGNDNLEAVFAKSYASIYHGEISISINEIEKTDSIAVVRGLISEKVIQEKDSRPQNNHYYFSLLANKIEGAWKAKWMMGVRKKEQ